MLIEHETISEHLRGWTRAVCDVVRHAVRHAVRCVTIRCGDGVYAMQHRSTLVHMHAAPRLAPTLVSSSNVNMMR